MEPNKGVITLHQLQLSIASTLNQKFAFGVWVSAEISEIKVNYSGHCYLELIEKGEQGNVARAQCRAVIWRNNFAVINSYFLSQTGSELCSGIKVLVKAQVNYHELYGLSLQITDIDPTYTLGEAERRRQQSIAQLKADGVWDMNREQPLSRLVQRVAIISSASAAGYQDFCNEIAASPYYFSLTLFDAVMQGDSAQESVVAALEAVALSSEPFDAVIIIRGGGSTHDLSCFDSYRIASHVAQFPLPVITGIGHDKDVSVVDMVSAVSLKTPTAVAGFLVDRLAQIEGWLDNAAIVMHDSAQRITHSHELKLERMLQELKSHSLMLLEQQGSKLASLKESLPLYYQQLLTVENRRLDSLQNEVELHSPDHLLRLGYAVARMGGVALSSSEVLSSGDTITITLHDGEILAEVKSIEKRKN